MVGFNKKLNLRKWCQALVASTLVFVLGCAKSPKGSIEELVKTRAPTIGGAADINYTTTSPPFVINGECDPISYDIEWSNDQSTWTTIPGACPSGTFTINVIVVGFMHVYVRARTKTGYTSSGHAYIRVLLPPTSPYYAFVSSGHAGEEALTFSATQNAVEHNFMANTLTNGIVILKQSLIDIIYE